MNSTLLSAQQVYKWVDGSGQVQYGDNPPEGVSNFAPVNILPGPSEAQKQQAEALNQQQSQTADEYKAKREAREAEKAKKASEKKAGDEVAQEKNTQEEKDHEPVYLPPCGSDLTAGRPCKSSQPVIKPRPERPVVPARPVQLPVTR